MKKYKKSDVACEWKIHKYYKEDIWYVGPVHGRLIVASFGTKNEAQIALDIQKWIVKMFNLKS